MKRAPLLCQRFSYSSLIACLSSIAYAQTPTPAPTRPPDPTKFSNESAAPKEPLSLWYRRPANGWDDAVSLGNGRLGAMVFGGVQEERIGLNEDTVWTGGPYNPGAEVSPETLAEIRRLLFEGKKQEAQNLAGKLQGNPNSQAAYQTVGELDLTFAEADLNVRDYRRQLDLDTGIANVTFERGGVHFRREVFVSAIDQAVVVRLTADKAGAINFAVTYSSPQQSTVTATAPGLLTLTGRNGDMTNRDKLVVPAALKFQSNCSLQQEGGRVSTRGSSLEVTKANAVTLRIVSASSYKTYKDVTGDPAGLCQRYLAQSGSKSYETMKREHVTEHQRLFRRVQLDFGPSPNASLPTNERLRAFENASDPGLVALYFQFGRYLLMSSSRPGGQPANLQGLWNDKLTAAWGGKYTVNINTEMNYWPAQTTNLSECEEPLLHLLQDVAETGRETASRTYHAKGWVLHHNTDLWRATAPIDGAYWGQWPMGGAWLTNHLYQRYLFDGDKAYLAKLYPLMKGAAQFFLDTLVEEPTHKWLVTSPSNSPEHEYVKGVSLTAGPTMDMDILRELFADCVEASQALGLDAELRPQWTQTRDRLAPHQIGKEGQLQEWLDDLDTSAPEIDHRHMSPFYGLFPGATITPADAKVFQATRKLAEMRDYLRPLGMGWAVAWRINIWARLLDAEQAYAFVKNIIATKTESNFFDKPSTQLDGNYGATAGIAEMLLQSHAGEIALLPALPKEWPNGIVRGLRARGGFEVDITWKEGKLVEATLHSVLGNPAKVSYAGKRVELQLARGGTRRFGPGM